MVIEVKEITPENITLCLPKVPIQPVAEHV
jgi:hypothetical protein